MHTSIITYLSQPSFRKPLITLGKGQFVTVPWPHTLQVFVPAGSHLQILKAVPERRRVTTI